MAKTQGKLKEYSEIRQELIYIYYILYYKYYILIILGYYQNSYLLLCKLLHNHSY